MDLELDLRTLDKSFILTEHEAALVKHNTNSEADARFTVGRTDISLKFKTMHLEKTPRPGVHSSAPVDLIPDNCVDIATLTRNPNKVLDGEYFLCRTFAPSYRSNVINAIVEDPEGQQGIRLSLYNHSKLSYYDLLEEFPVGQILAIKNPYLQSEQNGGLSLRCNNPENVVVISESMSQELFPGVKWEGQIPEKWQKFIHTTPKTPIEYKDQGNKEFILQKYEKALQSYTKGLNMTDDDAQITCDLLENRAAAYLKLDCFQSALEDVEKVLEIEPKHLKGLYRKGRALMGLQRFQEAITHLELELSLNVENLNPENQKLLMESLELAQHFLKQQQTGEYDILKVYKAGDVPQNDCADFVGPVKIQKINGNRSGLGLVATQPIQPGQLICATKAFEIDFSGHKQEFEIFVHPDTNVQVSDHPTNPQQNIVEKIAQKLTLEPNLGRSFYQLYAGPDFPIYDADAAEEPLGVDLPRIEAICQYNTFPYKLVRKSDCPFPFALGKSIGIWILPSLINHRCWDVNALWTKLGDMMFVRALKEILIGDEILMSYVDPSQLYEEREEVLKAHGFVCECRLCQIDRDSSKKGQKRMKLVKKIQENRNSCVCAPLHMEQESLMKKVFDLDKGGHKPNLKLNPSFHYPLHDLGMFYMQYNNYKMSINFLMKRHALTTNSALKQKAVESCFCLITVNLRLGGRVQEAKKWIETLNEEMKILYGTLDMGKLMAGKATLDLMARHNLFLQ